MFCVPASAFNNGASSVTDLRTLNLSQTASQQRIGLIYCPLQLSLTAPMFSVFTPERGHGAICPEPNASSFRPFWRVPFTLILAPTRCDLPLSPSPANTLMRTFRYQSQQQQCLEQVHSPNQGLVNHSSHVLNPNSWQFSHVGSDVLL